MIDLWLKPLWRWFYGPTSPFVKAFMDFEDPIIWLDLEERVIELNHAAAKFFVMDGQTRPLGKSLHDVTGISLPSTPGERWQDKLVDHGPFSGDFLARGRDGRRFEMGVHVTPLFARQRQLEGAMMVLHDVSAYASRSRILLAAEEMANLGGWELEVDSQRLTWTDQTYRIYGLPVGQTIELAAAVSFYDEAAQPLIRNAVTLAIAEGKPFDLELKFTAANGSRRWVRALGRAVWRGGKVETIYGTFQDITVRKQAEQELNTLREKLIEAERLASLGALTGILAHEVNNPLAVLAAKIDTLDRLGPEMTKEDLHKQIQIMRQAISRIQGIVQSFRAANLRLGHEGQREQSVDLVALLRQVIDFYADRAAQAQMQLVLKVPDGESLRIQSDETKLFQVFSNLLVNAMDALENSSEKRILIQVWREDQKVIIDFNDTGAGVRPEDKEQIFTPFFSRRKKQGGTGLGLSIVQRILQDLDGQIDLVPKAGPGACFRVTLQLAGRAVALPPQIKPSSGAKMSRRILVIEDEPALAESLQFFLREVSLEADVEHSFHGALDRLRRQHYALVISDFRLGEERGDHLLRQARALGYSGPWVFLTGYDLDVPPQVLSQVHAVVRKPVDFNGLAHQIRSWIDALNST